MSPSSHYRQLVAKRSDPQCYCQASKRRIAPGDNAASRDVGVPETRSGARFAVAALTRSYRCQLRRSGGPSAHQPLLNKARDTGFHRVGG